MTCTYSLNFFDLRLYLVQRIEHYCYALELDMCVIFVHLTCNTPLSFQSVVENMVAFRVHAPCSGELLLDIFANAVTPQEYLTGEPMKFKSVCKFKILCENLETVMVPLPDCASGEWGPAKATRLFGLVPVSHSDALVFSGRDSDSLCLHDRRILS